MAIRPGDIFGLIAADPTSRPGHSPAAVRPVDHRALGGKKIHPAWSVPGGVRTGLAREGRDHIRSRLPEAFETAQLALRRFKTIFDQFHEEAISFGDFPSLFMALVSEKGSWEHYDGNLRFVNSDGEIVADQVDPGFYQQYMARRSSPTPTSSRLITNPWAPLRESIASARWPGSTFARTWAFPSPTWNSRNTATGSTARPPHRSSTTTPG